MTNSLTLKRFVYACCLGIAVFAADFYTKHLTHLYLPKIQPHWTYPYGGIGIFKNFFGVEFSISHQINRGAAWGILGEYQVPLLYLRLLLILGLFIYLIFFNRHKSWTFPLTLILAGALGNVLDYFIYGHVVDMVHFVLWGYDYPVFNLADSAIFIGVCWLFLVSTFQKSKTEYLPLV